MHHPRLIIVSIVLLIGGLTALNRGGATPLTGQEPELTDRVQQLEARMAAVEARLAELEARLAPTPPATAATPGPAQPDVLLDLTGTTSRRTDTFTVTGSGIEVCWEITRSDASGTTPPRVAYALYRVGERNSLTSIDSNQRGAMACETLQIARGDYYFEVTMVFPGRWRLTVRPLP